MEEVCGPSAVSAEPVWIGGGSISVLRLRDRPGCIENGPRKVAGG